MNVEEFSGPVEEKTVSCVRLTQEGAKLWGEETPRAKLFRCLLRLRLMVQRSRAGTTFCVVLSPDGGALNVSGEILE